MASAAILRAGPVTSTAPVPVVALARTSTTTLQDPVASINRQFRSIENWLPEGFFIVGYYWDIESGAIDLELRSQTDSYKQFEQAITWPRDGGMAEMLAEATSPTPRFAAVVVEDIERSGRDAFNAMKLEHALGDNGVLLFATDELASMEGINHTTVLVRRIKQGIAEWYRLQLQDKVWKGLQEHSMAGWNIGPAPYGYQADRVPHPVPMKASRGLTKSRLIPDPGRAPVVAQIYRWRTEDHLGVNTITRRLQSDPDAYPPPTPAGWLESSVGTILRNPKYTGHMVFGRRRQLKNKTVRLPVDQWLWSPEPTHPAIISRATWDTAQKEGPLHSTSRDGNQLSSHPQARRTYRLRGRVRCRSCQHRMSGIWRPTTGDVNIYYMCPDSRHRPPDHPRSLSIREDSLTDLIREFFKIRVFGPERAALLAAQLPATAADTTRQRHNQADKLRKQLRALDVKEDGHAREIEALTRADGNPAGITALRTRLITRFGELETERAAITTQLKNLEAETADHDTYPELLDTLPDLASLLTDNTPIALEQALYEAFGIQILYKHETRQISLYATITDSTPATLARITQLAEDPEGTTTGDHDHLIYSDLSDRHMGRKALPYANSLPQESENSPARPGSLSHSG